MTSRLACASGAMTFFPILERELRVRARSRATYWTRSAVALTALLICLPQVIGSGFSESSLGSSVFSAIVAAAFLLSCGACLTTADLISEERRDGTLGLLLLTRVRTIDVLVGKVAPAGLSSLCAMMAFLPLLMIPVLVGGVAVGEALREGLVLLDTLWLSLAAGLWASSRGFDSFQTARKAVGLMLILVLGAGLAELITRTLGMGSSMIGVLSPLVALLDGRDAAYLAEKARFWTAVVLIYGLGWLLVVLAAFQVAQFSSEPSGEVKINQGMLVARPSVARAKDRDLLRQQKPIEWLVVRQPGVRHAIWGAAMLLLFYYVFARSFHFFLPQGHWFVAWLVWLMVSIGTDALLARAASKFFLEAKAGGQLEVLLTTPLGAKTIVIGHWRALKRMLRWPTAIALTAGVSAMTLSMMLTPLMVPGPQPWWGSHVVHWLLTTMTVVLTFGAVCWLAMRFALRGYATFGIIARVVGLATGVPMLFGIIESSIIARFVLLMGSGMTNWMFYGWGRQVLIILYFTWLIRISKRSVERQLAGTDPARFSLEQFLESIGCALTKAIQHARRWTP
jgi:hypothetical protein